MLLTMIVYSSEETQALGKKIGSFVTDRLIITLTGDLGSGKTTFVQGLAMGLEVPEKYYVTSPTYTIINEYPGRCRLFHIDLYRLLDSDDFEELGIDELFQAPGVIAVEWPEKLPQYLLSDYLEMHIDIIDDTRRKISIKTNTYEKMLSEIGLQTVKEKPIP